MKNNEEQRRNILENSPLNFAEDNKNNEMPSNQRSSIKSRAKTIYLILFGLLAVLIAVCAWFFIPLLYHRIVKWNLDKTTPRLEIHPNPSEDNLIWYKGIERDGFKKYTDEIDNFLQKYRHPGTIPGRGQNIYQCDYDKSPPPGGICDFDIKSLGPCVQENYYNYHRSSPCIFLKLNEIVGWMPEFYNNASQLPDKMPEFLKHRIEYLKDSNPRKLNTIWVFCEGENPADVENIGPIQFFPHVGFPGYYYPYKNDEGYLSPLVAVHFERPTRGVLINIECKVWAKNIKHDSSYSIGSVHFELLID